MATAGCLGALLKFVPREHLLQIIKTDVCGNKLKCFLEQRVSHDGSQLRSSK